MENIFSELNLSRLSVPMIRITDIIDIIIVASIIYFIFIWIKGTRAFSLFKGIIIIMAVSLLSYQFHFYTLSWIIEKTLSVGIIAIIIIFQPEFRRGLDQIGQGKVFNRMFNLGSGDETKDKKLNTASSEEIITACYRMSAVRTGALILIEQDIGTNEFEETGIKVDALISSQLIINIFEDKTPLHDGAILIRKNRISAALCKFPITKSEIGYELGTRHRAAVGASEVTDAIVIVVSEETGDVSVAHNGTLRKGLKESDLRKILRHDKNSDNNNKKPAISLWKGRNMNESNRGFKRIHK